MGDKGIIFMFCVLFLTLVFFGIKNHEQIQRYDEGINTLSSLNESNLSEIWVSSELWTGNEYRVFKGKANISNFLEATGDIEKQDLAKTGNITIWRIKIKLNPIKTHLSCHIREDVADYVYCRFVDNDIFWGTFQSKKIRDWLLSLNPN